MARLPEVTSSSARPGAGPAVWSRWRSNEAGREELIDTSTEYQNTHLLVSSLPLMYLFRLLGLSLRWCGLFRWNMLGVWMISIDRFGTILETK